MGPATPTPGLIDWNAGTGNESLFGDLAPGDTVATETATGQLIDPAAPPVTDGPEGQAAPPAASMGPATPTPGLIDWNAGTGNESLFGDLAPGDTVATETATGQLIDPATPPVTDGPEGQAAPPAASMGPATPTPGLIDWNAGTGNETLFGDGRPATPPGVRGHPMPQIPPQIPPPIPNRSSTLSSRPPTTLLLSTPRRGSPSTPP